MRFFSVFLISYLLIAAAIAADFSVTPEQLTAEINIRKTRVLEFKQLHDYGKEHGIRIWVAGGSAAGLAHYIKDDLENEFLKSQGEEPLYFEGRFGYNYFDIYRSTQDCDVIINGDEAQAEALEKFIAQKFDYLQGGKEIFEVRLLDKPRGHGAGEKDALLNNTDFSNQHTDSHSTGMIELTQPPITKSAVRDLLDWDNQKNSQFLLDVIDDQLSYYFSDKHQTTKRFKDGINPPILSVLRYYTKLFQYGLKPRPEDEKYLVKFIKEFDPQDPAWKESYVKKQINKNGVKMIRHAQDMEFAINTITRVGLKDKLLKFESSGDKQVSWWVNKEPLRSFPMGAKPGKTAKELGITIVAHETKDFLAYESITMSRRGVPNIFISRDGFEDEAAVHGNGFYTRIGEEGAAGSGLTIRYTVNPQAVDGTDFLYLPDYDFVIFINRNALKVIDESIELGPVEYFKILFEQNIEYKDKGVWQKIKLKVKSKIYSISKTEVEQIFKMIDQQLDLDKQKIKWYGIAEWFSLPISTQHASLLQKIIDSKKYNSILITNILSTDHWMKHNQIEKFLTTLISHMTHSDYICGSILSQEYWHKNKLTPILINQLFEYSSGVRGVTSYILAQPFWENDQGAKLVKTLMQKAIDQSESKIGKDTLNELTRNIITKEYWANKYKKEIYLFVNNIINNAMKNNNFDNIENIIHYFLAHPIYQKNKETEKLILVIANYLANIPEKEYQQMRSNNAITTLIHEIFNDKYWSSREEVYTFLNKTLDHEIKNDNKFSIINVMLHKILSSPPHIENHHSDILLEKIINYIANSSLEELEHQELNAVVKLLISKVFTNEYWATHKKGITYLKIVLDYAIKYSIEKAIIDATADIFSQEQWYKQPGGLELYKLTLESFRYFYKRNPDYIGREELHMISEQILHINLDKSEKAELASALSGKSCDYFLSRW